MNDFLKNLRTPQRPPQRGTHPRHLPPHRDSEEGQNLTINERRKILDRRSSLPQGVGTGLLLEGLNDAMPMIKENIAQIAVSLERMVDSQERLVDSELEKNQAISVFLQNLNQILTEKLLPILSASPEQQTGTAANHYQSASHHTKEDVINTIRSMRNNRATFAEIAEHLKSQGIPTFSGRGEWHAQTIHRLCK
ncbi:MAG: hypothetical protein V1793_00575 [Pseudomonadota bacterium]